jgi:hypothetical protein
MAIALACGFPGARGLGLIGFVFATRLSTEFALSVYRKGIYHDLIPKEIGFVWRG